MSKKTNRGTVKNWQLHKLEFTQAQVDKVFPDSDAQPIVFTGTTVSDPTNRRRPGDHMRSSLIVKLNKKTGIVETINSIYRLKGDGGNDVFPDLGNGVMGIFY